MLRLNEIYRHNDGRNYKMALTGLCLFVGMVTLWALSFFRVEAYLVFGIFAGVFTIIGYLHIVREHRKNYFIVDFRRISFLLILGIIIITIGVLV